MPVRAKFRVQSIKREQASLWDGTKSIPRETRTIELFPVSSGTEENKAFFASTPSGRIELGVVNLDAAKEFELNKEYYVDFTSVE